MTDKRALDRKKREEAERRAREDEELRVRTMQEEEDRRRREATEAAEAARVQKEENVKRRVELDELRTILEQFTRNRKQIVDERRKEKKWQRYLLCDGSPDPTIAGEINAYISLWREDETRVQVEQVLPDCVRCISLINELQEFISNTPSEELSEKDLNRHKKTIEGLEEVLGAKLDRTSHELLLRASELQDPETFNLQRVYSTNDPHQSVTLCMWGNISKNTRIKSYEFSERGFTFEVTRHIMSSDCAIRALFTKHDPFSRRCFSYNPRPKQPTPEELAKLLEKKAAEEAAAAKAKAELEAAEAKAAAEAAAGEQAVKEEEEEDIMKALMNLDDDGPKKEEKKVEEKQAEVEVVIEEDIAKEPEPTEWEEFEGDSDEIDLRLYQVVGDILHFDMLQLPPQPKIAREWTLTILVNPPGLKFLDYVSDSYVAGSGGATGPGSAMAHANRGQTDTAASNRPDTTPAPPGTGLGNLLDSIGAGVNLGGPEKEKKEEKSLIQIVMKLPLGYVYNEAPVLGRWDEKRRCWRQHGFEGIQFKEEERELSFRTGYTGTFALLQDRYLNMPFQSWSLRPRGPKHCALTIVAAIQEITIEIKGEEVAICEPQTSKQIEPLMNKWMKPAEFIKSMRFAGLNIFPEVDSEKYVSVNTKNQLMTSRLYEQMAMVSDSVAFAWSRWNSEIKDRERVVLRAGEHLEDAPLNEEELKLYLVTRAKVMKLQLDEFAEEFSTEEDPTVPFHADWYHMYVNGIATESGAKRVRAEELDSIHVNTVRQMLAATNVLVYS